MDFVLACKVWSHAPIIEAYFDSNKKVYNTDELKEIRKLRKKRAERRQSMVIEDLVSDELTS
jgi:hypothetical protein